MQKRKVFYSWGDLVGMTFCLSPREKWSLVLGRNNINDVLDKPQWNLVDNIVCLRLSRFEWADLLQVDIANYRTYPKSRGDNTSTHFNKHFCQIPTLPYQCCKTSFFFLICLFFFFSVWEWFCQQPHYLLEFAFHPGRLSQNFNQETLLDILKYFSTRSHRTIPCAFITIMNK